MNDKEDTKKTIKAKSNANVVPDFIQKLYLMLEDQSSNDIFSWNPSGTTFIVKDTNEFSKSILPRHFKHSNFASFVRQLNKYDFHKIRNSEDKLQADQMWEFEHAKFKRDQHELLKEIKRKSPGKKKQQQQQQQRQQQQQSTESPEPLTPTSSSANTNNYGNNSTESEDALADFRQLTQHLQSQVDDLRQSQSELQHTLDSISKTDSLIMTELQGFQKDLKQRNDTITQCMKQMKQKENSTPPLQPQLAQPSTSSSSSSSSIPASTATTPTTVLAPNWMEQVNPLESVLEDLFLTNQQVSQNALNPSIAAAAAQMNGSSLIRSSIKTPDGLHFLALGRLSNNKHNSQHPQHPYPHHPHSQQQQHTQPMITEIHEEAVPGKDDDKGKSKMVMSSWSTPPRVLLVDDDSVYRDVSGRMLSRFGCNIDFANNGIEALNKMSAEKYDLILMDIMMPKMDGIVTTRNIRRYDSVTPIVSMTSNFTQNDIMEYIGIGMNDILPKPFSKNTLYDILEKHCSHLKIIPHQQQQQQQVNMIPRGLSTLLQPQTTTTNAVTPLENNAPTSTASSSSSSSSSYPYTTATPTPALPPTTLTMPNPTLQPPPHSTASNNTHWQPFKRKNDWSPQQQQEFQSTQGMMHDMKRTKVNNQFNPNFG